MATRTRATPFGGAVAELRRTPGAVFDVLDRWIPADSEMGRAVRITLLTSRVDGREGPLEEKRSDRGVMAGMARVLFCILSETSVGNRRAMSRRLWQGEGDRTYRVLRIPGKRRGLAARVGLSTRQVQRYLAAFVRGGVLSIRQPPAENVPDRLRGRNHAFNVYRWCQELPRRVKIKLLEWCPTSVRPPRTPPARPQTSPRRPEPSSAIVARFLQLIPHPPD